MRHVGWVMLVGSLVADTALAVFMAPDFGKLLLWAVLLLLHLFGVGLVLCDLPPPRGSWAVRLLVGLGVAVAVTGLKFANLVYTYWYALPVQFFFVHSLYERDVARLRAGEGGGWARDWLVGGDRSDPNTPYAYSLGGILHRWSGFVYDPTNRLAKYAHPGGEKYLKFLGDEWFNSRITSVRRLRRDWYFCYFR